MDRRSLTYHYPYLTHKDHGVTSVKVVVNLVLDIMSPEKGWEFVKVNGPGSSVRPPREILKEFAKEADGYSEADVQSFAKQCLRSEDDMQMWLLNIQGVERMLRRRISRRQTGMNK